MPLYKNSSIRFIALSLLAISTLSCKTETVVEEDITNSEMAMLDSLGTRYLELNRFSGAIVIGKEDSIIYRNYFGLANYDSEKPFSQLTTFKIGKLSELLTAHIVRKMVEEGKLQMTDSISKYLPEVEGDFSITDLLHHQTGLPNLSLMKEQYPEREYSAVEFANMATDFPKTSNYSELDYNLLGLLIEKISGMSYQGNVEKYASELGLENTYFDKEDTTTAVGYLYLNHRGNGLELKESPQYNSEVAFSSTGLKATVDDVFKLISLNPDRAIETHGYLENDGFSYSVENNPHEKTATIVLSNRRHPVAKEIANIANSILQGQSHSLPLLRKSVKIDRKLLTDYAGSYALSPDMNLKVVSENDSLFVMMGPNKVHLIPQSPNQFFMAERDASLRFLRDSTNAVSEVELLDGFLEGNIIKRAPDQN